jgi:putative transposase
MKSKFPKKVRLPLEAYKDLLNPCVITVATFQREKLFKNRDFTSSCIRILKDLCTTGHFTLWAFCFMPDHLHVLIQGDGSTSIIRLVQQFKSLCTRKSREYGYRDRIFQTSFYDHFLRQGDEVEKHVRYILENPIRKGLVMENTDYPYSGSEVYPMA